MTTLHARGEYDDAVQTFRATRPAARAVRPVARVDLPLDQNADVEHDGAAVVEDDVDPAPAAPTEVGAAGEWDDLLADVARSRPAAGDSVDHADAGDLLPTCCLTGILGGVGSLIVFGSAAAVPCLVAAAAGTVLGVVFARA